MHVCLFGHLRARRTCRDRVRRPRSRIESETDELLDMACRCLFGMEPGLGIATMYWHQVLLWIADIKDFAERVGNRLRLLVAQ